MKRAGTLLLALILALTSLTMAVARGQTRLAEAVVICTGAGVTTITVDQDGHPVQQVHLCPDMVLGLMAALDTPTPDLMRPETRVESLTARHPGHGADQAAPRPRARGPPLG